MIPITSYTMYRAARIGLAFCSNDAPRKMRKRVLMKRMRIGGTTYNPGTVVNTVSVRTFFSDRQGLQDMRIDRYLETDNG